jgi:hypothetical protein
MLEELNRVLERIVQLKSFIKGVYVVESSLRGFCVDWIVLTPCFPRLSTRALYTFWTRSPSTETLSNTTILHTAALTNYFIHAELCKRLTRG